MSKWFHENEGKECKRFGSDVNPPTAKVPVFERTVVIEHEKLTPAGEKLPEKLVTPKSKKVVFTEVSMTTKKLMPMPTQILPTENALPTKKRGRPKLSEAERAARRKASFAKADKKRRTT